jgi:hypothetical protein
LFASKNWTVKSIRGKYTENEIPQSSIQWKNWSNTSWLWLRINVRNKVVGSARILGIGHRGLNVEKN